ncbi:putative olfactory receptor 10D4 [Erinaceus europaeus]|uniref:Olfactory receptor 10D4 n=1 Tax=Erinaceus europaeus TaxID=9365 RepID=A0A1S3AQS3_ERIEU|nr:putative olfactory receptor 10D4 [Erinaceus europaeus]
MALRNHTSITEFILLGIPRTEGQEAVLFAVFLAFYLCTLLGNLLILLAVLADARLHTPMYFFLCNLAVLDIGFSSVSTPKMLAGLLGSSRTITLGGCVAQVFFYHFLGCTECLLYAVMAYDRFAAVCHPLRYAALVRPQLCSLLAAGCWAASSCHGAALATLTFQLPFCGSNVVDYYFCDIFPVVRLACGDTRVVDRVSFTNISLVALVCFLLILASYMRIALAVLRMRSAEGRRKAASTCAAHLAVVTLFFGPCALIYPNPSLAEVLATPVQVFGNVVTPMLNPTIYALRNKDVKGALRKLGGGQAVSEAGH